MSNYIDSPNLPHVLLHREHISQIFRLLFLFAKANIQHNKIAVRIDWFVCPKVGHRFYRTVFCILLGVSSLIFASSRVVILYISPLSCVRYMSIRRDFLNLLFLNYEYSIIGTTLCSNSKSDHYLWSNAHSSVPLSVIFVLVVLFLFFCTFQY